MATVWMQVNVSIFTTEAIQFELKLENGALLTIQTKKGANIGSTKTSNMFLQVRNRTFGVP